MTSLRHDLSLLVFTGIFWLLIGWDSPLFSGAGPGVDAATRNIGFIFFCLVAHAGFLAGHLEGLTRNRYSWLFDSAGRITSGSHWRPGNWVLFAPTLVFLVAGPPVLYQGLPNSSGNLRPLYFFFSLLFFLPAVVVPLHFFLKRFQEGRGWEQVKSPARSNPGLSLGYDPNFDPLGGGLEEYKAPYPELLTTGDPREKEETKIWWAVVTGLFVCLLLLLVSSLAGHLFGGTKTWWWPGAVILAPLLAVKYFDWRADGFAEIILSMAMTGGNFYLFNLLFFY